MLGSKSSLVNKANVATSLPGLDKPGKKDTKETSQIRMRKHFNKGHVGLGGNEYLSQIRTYEQTEIEILMVSQ